MKVRLDTLLVQRGLAADEASALRLVLAHEVKVGDAFATSAAQKVDERAPVTVKGRGRYVSRGGLKLEHALRTFGLDVTGARCVDVGSSTGGFTDCLLQAGAASVACVDVNYGQLDWRLRSDPRTTVFERTNIRTADPAALGAPFDVAVCDLSFIGLASLASVLAALVREGGSLVALVKPQFESRPGEAAGGLVESQAVRARTVAEVHDALEAAGLSVAGSAESPITGKRAGNVEYLMHALKRAAV